METIKRLYPDNLTHAGYKYWRELLRRSGGVDVVGEPLASIKQEELENCLSNFAETYAEYLESAVAGDLVFATADLIQFAVNNRVSLELEWLMDFAVRIWEQEQNGNFNNEFKAFQHQHEMLYRFELDGDVEDLAGGMFGVHFPLVGNHAVLTDESLVIYKGHEFMAEVLDTVEVDFTTDGSSRLSYLLSSELMAKYSNN